MAKNNQPKLPDFEKMTKDIFTDLSPQLAEMAKGFFKGSFFKEGFTDYGFTAWPKRKDTLPHKILTKSQALRDSIVITEANSDKITITAGEGVPYASIHNYGGTINVTVTPKARRFFWYMFKKTENTMWKFMAITKKEKLTIKIPQRQFMGSSQTLDKMMKELIGKKMKEAQQKL